MPQIDIVNGRLVIDHYDERAKPRDVVTFHTNTANAKIMASFTLPDGTPFEYIAVVFGKGRPARVNVRDNADFKKFHYAVLVAAVHGVAGFDLQNMELYTDAGCPSIIISAGILDATKQKRSVTVGSPEPEALPSQTPEDLLERGKRPGSRRSPKARPPTPRRR